MASSSFVGTTRTVVRDASVEMMRGCEPRTALRSASISMPKPSNRASEVRADARRVLPYSGGERDDVGGPEVDRVRAEVAAQPVDVDVVGLFGVFVSGGDHLGDRPEIVLPAQSLQAGPLVEQVVDLVDGEPDDAVQVQHQAGIGVTAARPHHEALERRHAHRRVDGVPMADRRHRSAVAQVRHDLVHLVVGTSEELRGAMGT